MVIGITGRLGAGKGTVAAYLTKDKNFEYLSVRNFLAAEVLREGKMVTDEAIAKVAADLKAANGEDYLVKQLLGQAVQGKHYVVIESLRTPQEVTYMQTHGGLVWTIDAEAPLRYGRLVEAKNVHSNVPFEQFVAQETTRGAPVVEASKLANVHITNNGTKVELFAKVDVEIQKELTANT